MGSHLVRELVSRGRQVRIFDLVEPAADLLASGLVNFVHGNITESQQVEQAVAGCDEVYHLAANPRLWTLRRGDFLKVNYLGAKTVLDTAVKLKTKKILHCSTESILTRARQATPIRCDQLVMMSDVIGPYCRSKFLAEKHAFFLANQGHPVFIVNPTLPCGPGDRHLSPPSRLIVDFCKGIRKEYLDATLNFMDVRDMARGMVQVMEIGRPARRYILGAHNTRILELFAELSRQTGVPMPRWKVPYPLALAVACLGEIGADLITKKEPPATITGVRLTQRTMHFDTTDALAELQIDPTPLARTLRDAIRWWQENEIL